MIPGRTVPQHGSAARRVGSRAPSRTWRAGPTAAALVGGLLVVAASCAGPGAEQRRALPTKPSEPAAAATGGSGGTDGSGTADGPVGTEPGSTEPGVTDGSGSVVRSGSGSATEPGSTDPREPGAQSGTGGFEPTPVDWGPCDVNIADDYECGTLTAPLDYGEPDGETIDLALIRLPASGERRGAVLVNPGGPGGSGVDFVASAGTFIAEELDLGDFDVVGFDPRGVDRSGGLRCLTDAELDAALYPDEPGTEFDDDQFAAACVEEYDDTLAEYSTRNTARDMDLMRQAFGDDTISYLGISYGTYLGAVYATLFPDRVRALVLDSGFEPTGDTVEQQLTTQLVGFEEAFDNWAADCEGDPDCAFTADDVGAAWDDLQQQLDDHPLTADDGRTVTGDVMEQSTIAALYDELTWSTLSEALAAARDGDPAGLLALSDQYHRRDDDGTYATLRQSNTIITCASGLEPRATDDPQALVAEIRDVAPRFGDDVEVDDLEDGCVGLTPLVDPPSLGYDGDAPVMVVGGLNDPATPYRWSEELTAALGPSAVLVTWTGEGHGQALLSSCLRDLASAVLADLEAPDAGRSCDPDPDVPEPDWWSDVPVPDDLRGPLPDGVLAVLGARPTDVYADAYASSTDAGTTLDRFEQALDGAGFAPLGQQVSVPGITTLGALAPNGDVLVIATADPVAGGPELDGLGEYLEDGEIAVVVLYQPQ